MLSIKLMDFLEKLKDFSGKFKEYSETKPHDFTDFNWW